jgi:hypothetical protein
MPSTLVFTSKDICLHSSRRLYTRLVVSVWIVFALTGLALAVPHPIAAANARDARLQNPGPFSSQITDEYICMAGMMRRDPSKCPPHGPLARQTRLAYLREHLPNPLPELAVKEIPLTNDAITPFNFAYVKPLPAATYRHPEEAAAELPPLREFLAGDNWVSAMGSVEYEGEMWYEINAGEFIRAEHLAFTRPSTFRGVLLSEQPAYPFGWINRDVYASAVPGGAQLNDALLRRYERITMFAQETLGNQLWYMVGPDRWVEQSFTARVDVDPPPEGVAPGEKWIEINTFEQTLAAYEGERMVFATLMSSGRPATWTPNGLTRIWGKYPAAPMWNQSVGRGDPAWYYLEDVEWTQYFFGAYAIHSAYWHNSFAFTRSHGCVNLAISDAKWLFEWTSPYTPSDAHVVYSNASQPGTWVWVHKTPPSPNVVVSQ